MKSNIEIEVRKVAIKEWFYNESLPFGDIKAGILDDEEFQILKLIVEKDDVYLIIYFADVTDQCGDDFTPEHKALLTDLKSATDITFLFLMTKNLADCQFQVLKDYPEDLSHIIEKYIFGKEWEMLNPTEGFAKYLKHINLDDFRSES